MKQQINVTALKEVMGQMLQHWIVTPQATSDSLMRWVLQYHAPIQITRRFGHHEILLLSLQTDSGSIPFGIGAHECPGRRWAKVMTLTIVDYLRMLPINKSWLLHYRYKDSSNPKVVEFYSDRIFTECAIKRHSKGK